MLISEVIKNLEELKEKHGDLPCYRFNELDNKGRGDYSPTTFSAIYQDEFISDYRSEIYGPGFCF